MSKLNILITRKLLEKDKDYINSGLKKKIKTEYELIEPDEWTDKSLLDKAEEADIFLGPNVTSEMLRISKRLKLIQIPWAGVENINVEVFRGLNIPICNSHSNSKAVAEFGLSLVLDCMKKITYHDMLLRKSDWNRNDNPICIESRMIKEETICILGYGEIGEKLSKMLTALNFNVIGVGNRIYNTFLEGKEKSLSDAYAPDKWLDAISNATVVICSLPLTEKTKGMINETTLRKFNKNTILINLSRAEIIDEHSIYNALIENKIEFFASDVWWKSPSRGESKSKISDYPIHELSKVVLSPHRAGFVLNELPHLDDVIDNIIRISKQEEPMNQINVNKLY